MPRIYTRSGDRGTSSLYNGKRLEKDDHTFGVLGDVDELNAHIGMALCAAYESKMHEHPLCAPLTASLEKLQQQLIYVGSCVATPLTSTSPSKLKRRPEWTQEDVDALEREIDEMHAQLPPITTFVLPGGWSPDRQHVCYPAAHLHVCRVVCRRAERGVVSLWRAGDIEDPLMRYMNRLSDFFFTAARLVLHVFNEKHAAHERTSVALA